MVLPVAMASTCRICIEPLTIHSAGAVQLDCACRGDIGLVHRKCAARWFATKNSTVCDVCRRPVTNVRPSVAELLLVVASTTVDTPPSPEIPEPVDFHPPGHWVFGFSLAMGVFFALYLHYLFAVSALLSVVSGASQTAVSSMISLHLSYKVARHQFMCCFAVSFSNWCWGVFFVSVQSIAGLSASSYSTLAVVEGGVLTVFILYVFSKLLVAWSV